MKVVNLLDIKTHEVIPGANRRLLIDPKDGASGVLMLSWEIEPNCKSHSHSHPYEHGALILSGEGLLVCGDKQIPIKKNDVVFIEANLHHCFVNNSAEKLSYLISSQPHHRD